MPASSACTCAARRARASRRPSAGTPQVEDVIRPSSRRTRSTIVLDNIGIPAGGINLAFSDASIVSAADGEILVALKPGARSDAAPTSTSCVTSCASAFPNSPSSSSPPTSSRRSSTSASRRRSTCRSSGAIRRTSPSPRTSCAASAAIPGAVDVRLQQVPRYPEIGVDVDRTMAQQLGLTQRDVSTSLLVSLSSSGQTAPNYWLNPKTGVNYQVARADAAVPHRLGRRAGQHAGGRARAAAPAAAQQPRHHAAASVAPGVVSHYNVQPVFDVLAAGHRGRPLVGGERGRPHRRRGAPDAAARHLHHRARAGGDDADELQRARRPAWCWRSSSSTCSWRSTSSRGSIRFIILMALPGAHGGSAVDPLRHRRRTSPCRR